MRDNAWHLCSIGKGGSVDTDRKKELKKVWPLQVYRMTNKIEICKENGKLSVLLITACDSDKFMKDQQRKFEILPAR